MEEKLAATEKARTELLAEYTEFRVEELSIVADLEQQVDTATAELEEAAASHAELQREFADATAQTEKRYKELQQHRDIFSKSTDVQHNLAHEAGAEADGLKGQVSALTQKLVAAETGWEALLADEHTPESLRSSGLPLARFLGPDAPSVPVFTSPTPPEKFTLPGSCMALSVGYMALSVGYMALSVGCMALSRN